MISADRNFAAAMRQASRLDAALADWDMDVEGDLPGDLASALWCESHCPSQVAQHEERLQGWLS
ncbi:MAG: hypothetical protein ACRBC3_21825 [Burkholderiaceae bacterium]